MAVIHCEKMGGGFLDKVDRSLKTKAYVTAINIITGEKPIVNEYAEHTDINFTSSQTSFFRTRLDQWAAADPGEVRVNVKPVLGPWVIKKYWPVAAGAVLLGILIGKAI